MRLYNLSMSHPRSCCHAQSLTRVFIEDRQHLITKAIAELVVNEVDTPDVPGILWPKPDDGAIPMIWALPLFMTMGQLQPFFSPQAFYLFAIYRPAFNAQEMGNLAIPIAAILFGQPDHRQAQGFIVIVFFDFRVALRTAC